MVFPERLLHLKDLIVIAFTLYFPPESLLQKYSQLHCNGDVTRSNVYFAFLQDKEARSEGDRGSSAELHAGREAENSVSGRLHGKKNGNNRLILLWPQK